MKDQHFSKIFWYVCILSFTVMAYIFCVTFLKIDKENIRFVDTALGFLLGTGLSSGINYLIGGNPKDLNKVKEEPEEKEETKDI